MKIYYMRDNHTFMPLPLDVEGAECVLREEFEKGFSYGMLCSKSNGMSTLLHANGSKASEEFFAGARKWVQQAVDLAALEKG